MLVLLISNCVTLRKLFNFFVPQLPYLWNYIISYSFFLGVWFESPKRFVEVLFPGTFGNGTFAFPFGNGTFADVVERRSYWNRMGPKSNYWCPDKEREFGDMQTHTEKRKAELEWRSYKPKNAKDCQQPPKSRKKQERILPFRGSLALLIPWFWTSSP